MTRVCARTAKKLHRCDSCGSYIAIGTRYLVHVASPGHDDLGNEHWWRLAECRDCAARYGRDSLLDTQTPAVSGELLQADRGSDPPKGKRVTGSNTMTAARGAESVQAPHALVASHG